MNIKAMIVFWDEPAQVLYELAHSAGQLADEIVAADGPFALYPHTEVESSTVALAALRNGAEDSGTKLTLLPGREWAGQVEKRSAVAQACAPCDWVFWMDADERIVRCESDTIRYELERTATESFIVQRHTPKNPEARWRPDSIQSEQEDQTFGFARLYRHYERIEVRRAHWCYIGWRPGNETGFTYWAEYEGIPKATVGNMSKELLLFEHLQTWRSDAYREKQLAYRKAVAVQVAETGEEA